MAVFRGLLFESGFGKISWQQFCSCPGTIDLKYSPEGARKMYVNVSAGSHHDIVIACCLSRYASRRYADYIMFEETYWWCWTAAYWMNDQGITLFASLRSTPGRVPQTRCIMSLHMYMPQPRICFCLGMTGCSYYYPCRGRIPP